MANMIFARPDGQWFDFPALEMAAMSGNKLTVPNKLDLIPLPEGATLTLMPEAAPVGFDKENGEFLLLDENPYKKKAEPVYAVGALLPQGFTRLLLPAVECGEQKLPILGYTAVGIEKGKLVVAAAPTDEHRRWHPKYFNTPELEHLVEVRKKEFPGNRIINQLSRCALEYGCFTGQNIFYRRWEGGIPSSPVCNADCLACISQQPDNNSPQQRITFCPLSEEIAEVAVAHLKEAKEPMISFGQGCEGEPSLSWKVICESIGMIRKETSRGSININTNAGNTKAIAELLSAGMNSLRVSLFSPIAAEYEAYHQPKDYTFADVCASLALAKAANVPVAFNLLAYPGFTDTEERLKALADLIVTYNIRQVQMRNLNCDPRLMEPFNQGSEAIGMRQFMTRLKDLAPGIEIGSYSHDMCGHENK